jgi:hypothetical protein
MMLEGVSDKRIQIMVPQELRWLENAKKAFHSSDLAFSQKHPEDDCFPCLCRAIDTAKTLHRSLRDQPNTKRNNRKEFIDFIHLEIPRPEKNGVQIQVTDSRTGKLKTHGFGELIYEIRCMVHENENLNLAEGVDYHIAIDWFPPHGRQFAELSPSRVIVSGQLLWGRLREVLSMFLSIVESTYNFPRTGKIEENCSLPLEIFGNRKEI